MGWLAEQGTWKSQKVLKRLFKGKADVRQHFMIRLFQRFDIVERRSIIRELHYLLKSEMYSALFEPGEENIRVTINNDITMCVKMSPGGRLVLKTIFPTGR
jgi:hypothetical protein